MSAGTSACRVCLAVDVRLLTIGGSLQLVYEKITSTAITQQSVTTVDRPAHGLSCALSYSRAECLDNIPCVAVQIKTEPVSDGDNDTGHEECNGVAVFDDDKYNLITLAQQLHTEVDIKDEDIGEDSPQSAEEADICDEEFDSELDDPISLTQQCGHYTERGIKEEVSEEDIASNDTSGADRRETADGSATNRKRRESRRESTSRTAHRSHECDLCHRQFKWSSNLYRHRRTHTGEKPYECEVCEMRFKRKAHLTGHLSSHSGEKHHECDVCQRRFNRKDQLSNHLRVHSGEKPYECNVCHARFNRKANLISHLRVHVGEKRYECNVCQRRFYVKSHLVHHVRTHTGEKPYQCEVCKRRFKRKDHLVSHIRVHNDRAMYECNVCQRNFYKKGFLVRHFKVHTGEPSLCTP
ncbi:zinc finger protein 182 isoform X2 [Amyelois transitella]|uniref:zinc finger protein 182 isoform X2 n=1 Tax=Amyelois transitella TaxID=680683 RepID=UPI00298FA768|nr:zinc finger protein 182 isoform X2 [Amyelois transitella]